PGAPIRRRKRIRRIIYLLLLLAIGLSAWRWGPAAKQHAQLLYWQRQCMNHQIPSNAVLNEQDPRKAAVLLSQPNPDFVPMAPNIRTQAIYYPRSLREFDTRAATLPLLADLPV